MIPHSTIDKILQSIRIEEVIGETVKLKPAGSILKGLCPFHNEKTPSFTVSPHKGIWHCYGCSTGGDVIAFVMRDKGMTFPEAAKFLATKANIQIQETAPDPDADKKAAMREQLFAVNEFAAAYYQQQLQQTAPRLKEATDRFGTDNISLWRLGFAPDGWANFYQHARAAGYLEEFLLTSGLIKQSEKNNKIYDYFRNRLMFPVFNKTGRITGFSARQVDNDKDNAKYINSPDTAVYLKSHQLYGIHLAARAMRNDGAVLVEGNPDAIRMHQVGADSTVAPCGTAVTEEQLKIIKQLTNSITIITDGDAAGQKSMNRTGRMAVEMGLMTYCAVLPEKEDPDTFFTTEEQYKEWIATNRQDWILLRAKALLEKIGHDPGRKNEAIKELCGFIQQYDEPTRKIYIDAMVTAHKVKAKLFTDRLKDLDQSNIVIEKDDSLPTGVDARDFERWGFYENHNSYYVRTKDGVDEVSNFVMKPVFHIEGQDSRRVYDVVNFRGFRMVVGLDMQEMTSIQAFRRNIEGRGNFIFSGTDTQFTRIKAKLYEETRTCTEIRVLGWQKEGFFAWSNGITTEDGFQEIDEYGIVEFNKTNYFIPAYSSIHINDKSVFIGERKFQYKQREITMLQWADQFADVFGTNARIGICFWVATIFRDYILFLNKNFPILNLFGPKGTGKSQMAMSLSCLFGEQQTPYNIHNGTKAGLAEHMQQFSNAFAWVDEYKNNIDYALIETLKSIYDAIGRNRLNVDKRKETTLVNATLMLTGQEMPTADVALFTRLLFLQFHKAEYNDAEKKLYDKLKKTESAGLSHLTAEILSHRKYFEKEFWANSDYIMSDISDELRDDAIEDRMLRSWCTVAAALRTLQNKVNFGFGYADIRPIIIKGIKQQNEQVSKSNEIGQFWEMIEAMYDENILIDGWHFRVTWLDKLKTTTGNRELGSGRYVLRLKFSTISKLYAENARRTGIKPLPNDTLSYYLKNSKSFLGVSPSVKFIYKEYNSAEGKIVESKTNTSAYCFDYKKLNINLIRGVFGDTLPNETADNDEPDNMINHLDKHHVNGNHIQSEPQTTLIPENKLPF